MGEGQTESREETQGRINHVLGRYRGRCDGTLTTIINDSPKRGSRDGVNFKNHTRVLTYKSPTGVSDGITTHESCASHSFMYTHTYTLVTNHSYLLLLPPDWDHLSLCYPGQVLKARRRHTWNLKSPCPTPPRSPTTILSSQPRSVSDRRGPSKDSIVLPKTLEADSCRTLSPFWWSSLRWCFDSLHLLLLGH